jgi:type VI protein secretion system component Hcp
VSKLGFGGGPTDETQFQLDNFTIEVPVDEFTIDLMQSFVSGQTLTNVRLNIGLISDGKDQAYMGVFEMPEVQISAVNYLHGSMRDGRYSLTLHPVSIKHIIKAGVDSHGIPLPATDFTLNFAQRSATSGNIAGDPTTLLFYIASENVLAVPPQIGDPLMSLDFGIESLYSGGGLPDSPVEMTHLTTTMPANQYMTNLMYHAALSGELPPTVISTIKNLSKGAGEAFRHKLVHPILSNFQLTYDSGMNSLVLQLDWQTQKLTWEDAISQRSTSIILQ